MEIAGVVDHGDVDLVREGFALDGSTGVVRGNRLFRTFYWVNWDEFAWGKELYLTVYDVETDKLLTLIDPNWVLSYADIAERRQGSMFAYLGAGKGLEWNTGAISTYHSERPAESIWQSVV